MEKDKKFSIGEIAKLTGVTIRTLQYYDNIGLVPSEKEVSNGRRYYREFDLTRLQQVLFYKSLGLQIKDIKKLIIETAKPYQISSVLKKQRDILYHKLNDIKMNISFIDTSLISLEQNKSVPMKDMINLIISLNKDNIFEYKNVEYDEAIKDIFMDHHENTEEFIEIYWKWKSLIVEAVSLILNGVVPESEKGKDFGSKWIKMITEITGGNLELLEAHKISYKNRDKWPEEDRRLIDFADEFIDKAVESYLSITDYWKDEKND